MQEQLLVFARRIVSLIRVRVICLPDIPPVLFHFKKTWLNKKERIYTIVIANDVTATIDKSLKEAINHVLLSILIVNIIIDITTPKKQKIFMLIL
ncbi:hypothetical protein [Arsenophonus apicola]|uniref:hypothetical protein n=1 Tax=Arsenophonus apicola TaxID=2879119 RepID=UPI001CDD3565|nr:hypothetical protein [Arsenophonus apicola]UBX27929.1 hypothetical protein LDL57_08545 [Arsenophonus apicola]UBX30852.1 hypothetical protein LDL57_16640 [Arsenophonus apicola]